MAVAKLALLAADRQYGAPEMCVSWGWSETVVLPGGRSQGIFPTTRVVAAERHMSLTETSKQRSLRRGVFGLGSRMEHGEAPPCRPNKNWRQPTGSPRLLAWAVRRKCHPETRFGDPSVVWECDFGTPCRSRCVGRGRSRYHGSGRSPCTAFEMTAYLWGVPLMARGCEEASVPAQSDIERLDPEELTRCSRCGYVPAPLPDKYPVLWSIVYRPSLAPIPDTALALRPDDGCHRIDVCPPVAGPPR